MLYGLLSDGKTSKKKSLLDFFFSCVSFPIAFICSTWSQLICMIAFFSHLLFFPVVVLYDWFFVPLVWIFMFLFWLQCVFVALVVVETKSTLRVMAHEHLGNVSFWGDDGRSACWILIERMLGYMLIVFVFLPKSIRFININVLSLYRNLSAHSQCFKLLSISVSTIYIASICYWHTKCKFKSNGGDWHFHLYFQIGFFLCCENFIFLFCFFVVVRF